MIRLGKKKMIVNMHNGTSILGTKRISWPWSIRMGNASVREPGREPVRADGVVLIPLRAVQFAQIID